MTQLTLKQVPLKLRLLKLDRIEALSQRPNSPMSTARPRAPADVENARARAPAEQLNTTLKPKGRWAGLGGNENRLVLKGLARRCLPCRRRTCPGHRYGRGPAGTDAVRCS